MGFTDIYMLGRKYPVGIAIPTDDHKLKTIRFWYTSKEVTATTLLIFIAVFLVYYMISMFNGFFAFTFLFLGFLGVVIVYIYPTHIFYSQKVMDYNEQMLKAILGMSNYVSMNTSMEYAFSETTKNLRGVLHDEFKEISHALKTKEVSTLGHAIEKYLVRWNEVNPVFVKSLRLLETASMAEEEDRENILKETFETLILEFNIHGKRSAEELAAKAKGLISFGVLLPITSLMLLPLLSIFMSDLVKPGLLFFIYNIFFPIIILLMALNFANKRIQVDTINLSESKHYKKIPGWVIYSAIAIAIIFLIPGINHLLHIDLSTPDSAEREYQFFSVFSVWLMSLGIIIGIYMITNYYVRLHKETWENVKATEDDLPHLLQVFSTFLSLNLPMENIIPNVAEDYKSQGFGKHPIVKVFNTVSKKMIASKQKVGEQMRKVLKDVCPSDKVANVLNQIVSFSDISQQSGEKAAKLIRQQTISIYQLDDYIRGMLAETVGLVNAAINMLMPMLCAVAVIMSLLIVKSLTYITVQLTSIQRAFGSKEISALQLVDVTSIIPPTLLEIIVGFYFIEMFLVLSLFSTKVKIGNDTFQLAKAISSNMMGYFIYSVILLAGHFVMSEVIFKGVLGA